MAVGHLTIQQSTPAGAAVTFSAATATDGDDFPLPDSDTILLIQNGDSNPTTATITSYATATEGLAVANKTVTVAAGVTKIVKLTGAYADPTTTKGKVVLSNVTSCKVAAIHG